MRGLPERTSVFDGLGDLVPQKRAETDLEQRARRRREQDEKEREAGQGPYGVVVSQDGKFKTTRHP